MDWQQQMSSKHHSLTVASLSAARMTAHLDGSIPEGRDVLRNEDIVPKMRHRALQQVQGRVSVTIILQAVKTTLVEMGFAGIRCQTVGLDTSTLISLSTLAWMRCMYSRVGQQDTMSHTKAA